MLRFNGLKISAFNELIRASGILFLASVLGNVCNLSYWLFMVRRLNPVEYGILNALFSLFMILSLPANTIQTVITKFVAGFYSRRELSQIKYFIIHFGSRVFMIAVLFLAVFVILSPAISSFLKISSVSLVIITGAILSISMILPVTIGVLQGAQRFVAMAVNGIFSSFLKLILGIILVIAGFKVMGALLGLGLAIILAFALSFFQLPREITLTRKEHPVQFKMDSVYQYSLPVFFSLLGWMVLTNGDVILVKHFFSPEEAGYYSVAQMVGKIILFLPAVIGVVLFPKMSEAFSKEKSPLPLLKKGLAITGSLCVGAAILCSLFPQLVLKIITRREEMEAVSLVPLFCLAMTFYALVNLFVFYNLAIQRFRFTVYILLASFLQMVLISLFHPHLSAVLFSLIFCSAVLLLAGYGEMAISK